MAALITTSHGVNSLKHKPSFIIIRREYGIWFVKAPQSQPQNSSDVRIECSSPSLPSLIPLGLEETIVSIIKYYADNNTPLIHTCGGDLINPYVELLPFAESRRIKILDRRLSDTCIINIVKRHGLCTSYLQGRGKSREHRPHYEDAVQA